MDLRPTPGVFDGAEYHDVARFVAGDPPEQVAAALSCIGCLAAASTIQVEFLGQLPLALCRCDSCFAITAIELDSAQARRIVCEIR